MMIFPLFHLLTATISEGNDWEIGNKEVFPISEPNVLDAYCQNLVSVKLSSHRPQLRQSRAIGQLKDFSPKELDEFTEEHWRIMLGDKFELKCSADEFVPRRRDQLRNYPEMTCHHLCRACFRNSLPVCLRRNPDNDFGISCYCSYDSSSPIVNHAFKIFD